MPEQADVRNVLRDLSERLTAGATVRAVFGDVMVQGDRAVVPVARVAFGFGGGAGTQNGRQPEEAEGTQAGSGGGAGANITPLGFLEVGPNRARFVPIVPRRRVVAGFVLGAALGLWAGRRLLG